MKVFSFKVISIFKFLDYLPFLEKWRENEKLKEIAENTGWLSFDRLISMAVGFFVTAWVARYLGPSKFGLLNYALSILGLAIPFARLGLKDIAVRNIVRRPEEKDKILGSSFFLSTAGGVLGAIGVLVAVLLLRGLYSLVFLLTTIVSLKLILISFSTIDYWFHSQVKSKYTVWARRGAFLLVVLVKIVMILMRAPLIAFAWAVALEALLAAVFKIVFYFRRQYSITNWTFELKKAKSLLKQSWPLIISSLAIAIYMKVDRIMLGQILGDSAVGIYSVAAKISEVWYFIPTAIATSVFPALLRTQEEAEHLYSERMQLLYDLMAMISYVIALPLSIIGGPLVTLVFGAEYASAASIITVHVWAFVFVSLGVARSRWLIAENFQFHLMTFTVFGALINIALNILLIPRYGGLGAAWATVIAQLNATYLSSLFLKRFWSVFKQETKAILLPLRFRSFVESLKNLIG